MSTDISDKKFHVVLLTIIIIGTGLFITAKMWVPKLVNHIILSDAKVHETKNGVLDIAYTIDGKSVLLVNGKAETPSAPRSASKIITTVFGSPLLADINGDGENDGVMIVTQDTGGSGTFFYVVAAVHQTNKFIGTNAVLLGDRIAPQNVQVKNGLIIVNFAERKAEDPMTTPPSLGVSKYLIIKDVVLTEVPAPVSK